MRAVPFITFLPIYDRFFFSSLRRNRDLGASLRKERRLGGNNECLKALRREHFIGIQCENDHNVYWKMLQKSLFTTAASVYVYFIVEHTQNSRATL